MTTLSLSEYLQNQDIISTYVPMNVEKFQFINQLIKFTPILKDAKIVTNNKEKRNDMITFKELQNDFNKNDYTFYIITNLFLLVHYNLDILKERSNNKFILIRTINDNQEKDLIRLNKKFSNINLYIPSFRLDINLITNERKAIIQNEQLEKYKNEFSKCINIEDTSKYLNVYFDEIVTSLENLSINKALLRSPKFQNIILEISLHNKKRHLINLIDGKYGIDSFLSVYEKLKDKLPIFVIKSTDEYELKIKKISKFNETNSPFVLLTDYNLSDELTPKNIDYFHITNNKNSKCLLNTFYNLILSKNYSGIYPRDFNIVSHVGVIIGNTITIDLDNYESFMKKYKTIINYNKQFSDINFGKKLYLKGDEFYIDF